MKKKNIHFINKYFDGSLSDKEKKEFEALCSSGEIDINELEGFNQIIYHTKKISPPKFVHDRINISSKSILTKKRKVLPARFKTVFRIAAILIPGIFLGALIMFYVLNTKEIEKYVRVETKRGDKIHITLPGNNEAWLNSRSSIEYAESFIGANRVINLSGEAYLKFSENINSPILLNCNHIQIMCSEATLNVECDTLMNQVEIEVETGWVAVSNPQLGNRQFIVESGFKGVFDDVIPLWIEQNKNPNYLAWHTGQLVFKKTTLKEVAQTLSEVYDVNIDVQGDVKYCFFSNEYTNENLENILNSIKNELSTNIKHVNNKIIITGNPC